MQISTNDPAAITLLTDQYQVIRKQTIELCRLLEIEDFAIQSMADVSPPKWHLAHTTWFFENFLLSRFSKDYNVFHPQFHFLFNSYYESVGKFHLRQNRGLLSRPTIEEITSYRAEIDHRILELLEKASLQDRLSIDPILTIGLHHEQQHQELLITDIKYNFFCNPLKPAYRVTDQAATDRCSACEWKAIQGGVHFIGCEGKEFSYDNEKPRHKIYIDDFELASRLVSNKEYLAFIEDRGYEKPELWLSDGWKDIKFSGRKSPIYWEQKDGSWMQFTTSGMVPLALEEPVCHVSFYEAAAYARWAGYRLPTEYEWEVAAQTGQLEKGNFIESGRLHPRIATEGIDQLFGDAWEWTQSPYTPYPGYRAPFTAIGEYNGKFMCNQQVLRGGSCFTSATHIRPSYRNFFYPSACWQCTGIRLAREKKKKWLSGPLSTTEIFLHDVVEGLRQMPKTLSSKYFYDKKGSELFDSICQQPEYYLTRTEEKLLQQAAQDLKATIPDPSSIIEFGSGNCEKMGYLLEQIPQIKTVVPIDISKEFIRETAQKLKQRFAQLNVHPIAADFLKLKSLPAHQDLRGKFPIIFFPGSTIGNFEPQLRIATLQSMANLVKPRGALLIGVDLVKDAKILEAAYNDQAGVTAAFNRNLIKRINLELNGNFPVDEFAHRAFFNAEEGRMEMHLVCLKKTKIKIGSETFFFEQQESIHTENSYKFDLKAFADTVALAGFTLSQYWTDSKGYFGLLYFTFTQNEDDRYE
ncbi:MAG: ergothioneine biosynthesis protein EgtB [Chlamydiota bacterium]